jgi:chromosome partitioning protein
MVDTLKELDAKQYRVLLTVIPPKPRKDGDEARAAIEDAGLPLFRTGIREYSAFQKAAHLGVPVYDVKDPRAGLGWDDYRSVGMELVQ